MTATNMACLVERANFIDMDLLYRSKYHKLKNFLRRYLDNDSDIEDIVQDAFLVAITKAESYLGLSRDDVWLFGIAKNLALNHINKVKNRKNYVINSGELSETEIEKVVSDRTLERNPSEICEHYQQLEAISGLIYGMPKSVSNIYIDVVLEERPYQCVANQHKVPIGTVRSKVARARKQLRNFSTLNA